MFKDLPWLTPMPMIQGEGMETRRSCFYILGVTTGCHKYVCAGGYMNEISVLLPGGPPLAYSYTLDTRRRYENKSLE